jgi:diketogulonate reductase-like aldo/keto reductase
MTLCRARKFGSVILGTDKSHGPECMSMIKSALFMGYRIIDTAQAYGNETEIGQAIRETDIHREDVFLITKVSSGWKRNPSTASDAYDSVQRSLDRLGVSYLDLCLIHSPGADASARRATWQGLEKLYRDGLVKSVGVSNFGIGHLRELSAYTSIGLPNVNQIEVSDCSWFPLESNEE